MIMEILTHKPHINLLLITLLSFFCICRAALSAPGSIQLSQQLLLSSLDAASAVSQPFLTSPSGTYEAFLVRTQTASGDTSCSILVQGKGKGGGNGVRDSNIIGCGRISGSHICSLVFSTAGLGIFDGMKLTWSTSIPSRVHAKGLVLLDSGDMVISDSSRRIIAWKASESRIVADHNCGSGFSPFGNPSEESLGRQVPPLDLSGDEQQQDSVMGGFEQQQDSTMTGFEQQQDSVMAGFEQQQDSVMGGFEQQQDSVMGGYEQQQDSVIGGFEQRQEGLGNYRPKQQPRDRRQSGFLGFDDQEGHTDYDDSSVNGASGRGLEMIGVVIVTFIYVILIIS